MSYLKTPPILPMEGGPERELMACFFRKLKHIKGLTTALDQIAGVNGKWLKPDEPHNIPSKRLLRIVLHTMHHLGREECKRRTILAIDYVFDHILPVYVDHLASKRKQRPPSIRRLYRRRYRPTYRIIITHQIINSIKTIISYEQQSRTTLYPAFQPF